MRHRNSLLTSTYINVFDMYLTKALRSTRPQRAPEAGSSRGRLVLSGVLCLSVLSLQSATAGEIDNLKLYAHSRIVDYKEFQCFNKIITKESRWNKNAVNGSHYGLGQMRSKWYRNLDAYRQIDATIKYITNRYQTPCKAWAFHIQRNHY